MRILIICIITSMITSIIISFSMMKLQLKFIKKWLADFFDKQDIWLREHLEELVQKLLR